MCEKDDIVNHCVVWGLGLGREGSSSPLFSLSPPCLLHNISLIILFISPLSILHVLHTKKGIINDTKNGKSPVILYAAQPFPCHPQFCCAFYTPIYNFLPLTPFKKWLDCSGNRGYMREIYQLCRQKGNNGVGNAWLVQRGGGFHCSPHFWIFTQEISLTEGKGSQGVGKYLNIIGLSSVRGGIYQWW